MGLLSSGPRIGKEDGCVVARTGYLSRVLFLGTALREVLVNPAKKRIVIRSRYVWLFKREKKLRFKHVDAITYGYEDVSPDSMFSYSHHARDCFSVGLRLVGGDELKSFSFYGQGGFVNDGPWPDWCYWDEYAFDFVGNQESEALAFVELLEKMIGVKTVRPRY